MNHLMKCFYKPVPQKTQIKQFTVGKTTYLQGQILHIASYRMTKLALVLNKLSDEETQRTRLCISQTFPNLKKAKKNKVNASVKIDNLINSFDKPLFQKSNYCRIDFL